jgi:hypothetical protein
MPCFVVELSLTHYFSRQKSLGVDDNLIAMGKVIHTDAAKLAEQVHRLVRFGGNIETTCGIGTTTQDNN